MEFRLPYYISNNSDGSTSLRLCSNVEEAKDEKGWTEPSANVIHLKLEDNKLFYRSFVKIDDTYGYSWKEIK